MVYLLWALGIVGVALVITIAMAVARRQESQRAASEAARRRFDIPASGERIPLAPEREAGSTDAATESAEGFMPQPPRPLVAERPAATPSGRLVNTPDGEMILTTPPFTLRDAIFRPSVGRFVNSLSRRLPAWVIVCPRVRLDTLVVPTKPKLGVDGGGEDAADWREWRKRVRVRSLDLVLCDRRNWRPLVAVLFDARGDVNARSIAGGQDRMIDEVMGHVGLPLLHLTGNISVDWPLIQPYVEESILHHLTDEELLDASNRARPIDGDGAVTLLRMDQDKGWVLE